MSATCKLRRGPLLNRERGQLIALAGIIRQKVVAIKVASLVYVLRLVFVCLRLHKHAKILPP